MADNELVSTNSSNVNKVNTDVHSMTSELQQMALAAKSLETSLKGVNNQLTATSKLTGRSLKQMQQYQKTSAKVKVGGQEKMKERGVLKVVSDLKSAILPLAGLITLIKQGAQTGQQAVNNTKELSEKFNTLGGDLTAFSTYLREATTAAKNRAAINTTADAVLDASRAKSREDMFGWIGNLWSGTKKKAAETISGTNLQTVSYNEYLAQAQNQLMNKGYDMNQLGLLSDAAVTYAWKNASQYNQNTGLDANAVFQTPEFQSEFSRILGILAGGATDAVFQGYLAESLGDAYIPDVTRSKSVMADYQLGMLTQLANMSLTSQQDKLSEWDNAGTVLQSIGKNLYSFDEVISQNAIEVEDKKASKILGSIETNLKDKDNILKDMETDLGSISGRTGGTSTTPTGTNVTDIIGGTGGVSATPDSKQKFALGVDGFRLLPITGAGVTGGATGLSMNVKNLSDADKAAIAAGGGFAYKGTQLYSDGTNVYVGTSYSNTAGERIGNTSYQSIGSVADYAAKNGYFSYAYEGAGALEKQKLATAIAGSISDQGIIDSIRDKYDLDNIPSYAAGGVGTHRVDGATLFENGPEAVIPLSSQEGINYLSNAMKEAGGTGSNINVTVELSGINIADNDRQWNEVARKIGERINTVIRREGSV